eukprot:gene11995-15090_t
MLLSGRTIVATRPNTLVHFRSTGAPPFLRSRPFYHSGRPSTLSLGQRSPSSSSANRPLRCQAQATTAQSYEERVIITSSGVVVACWQVLADGSEPAELRRQLGQTLLNAPSIEGQMVKEPSMLHTTVARLLLPPGSDDHSPFDSRAVVQAVQTISESLLPPGFDDHSPFDTQAVVQGGCKQYQTHWQAGWLLDYVFLCIVEHGRSMPEGLSEDGEQACNAAVECGLHTMFKEVWFVEELDLLALALDGRYLKHHAPLECPRG